MFIAPRELRRKFSKAMSDMYQVEVPDYKKVMDLVRSVNRDALKNSANIFDVNEISEERHGAIRLGKPSELATLRRLFAVMDMHPVGYYDLSVAGIPVHSTAFRPVSLREIEYCPFRIFTSLLRLDLIADTGLRQEAEDILAIRDIFSPLLLEHLDICEKNNGLTKTEAEIFITELVHTFEWSKEALISKEMYEKFHHSHRLIADIVSFKKPHINHLTPRTLDIDKVQEQMPEVGLNPKAIIEGPPKREVPILLRQTAFKALEEDVLFPNASGAPVKGTHTARFGEIEQRGIALTPKGQELYDSLLDEVRAAILPEPDGSNKKAYMDALNTVFERFPDDMEELRRDGLAYFKYEWAQETGDAPEKKPETSISEQDLDKLIERGVVILKPITYEDFLPVSAAGIFQSNLGDSKGDVFNPQTNQQLFETVMGAPVRDRYSLYEEMQKKSIRQLCA